MGSTMDPSPDSSYVQMFAFDCFPCWLDWPEFGHCWSSNPLVVLPTGPLHVTHSILQQQRPDKTISKQFSSIHSPNASPAQSRSWQGLPGMHQPLDQQADVMYLPDCKTCGEPQISSLHLQILMLLLSNLFHQFVQNHSVCTTLKNNNVFLPFNRNTGPQQRGIVDHVFYIKTPDCDPPFEPSLWFNHNTEKNKDCEFHSKCSEFQNLVIFQWNYFSLY